MKLPSNLKGGSYMKRIIFILLSLIILINVTGCNKVIEEGSLKDIEQYQDEVNKYYKEP